MQLVDKTIAVELLQDDYSVTMTWCFKDEATRLSHTGLAPVPL